MLHARAIAFASIIACLAFPLRAQTAPTSRPVEAAGTAVYAGDELLKDYHPTPALVTKVTPVERPKFPVIDIHCHWTRQMEPKAMLKAMDDLGVQRAANMSGGFGVELEAMLTRFHAASPERLLIFANVDFASIDQPAFAADAVAGLERAKLAGVSGLKIFKNLGLTLKDKSGSRIAVDDPRLDPIFEACGRLKLPVLIHSGDPLAFFQPIDARNERWMQLKRHPDWSFVGPAFPTYPQVMKEHDRRIARHPETIFISAHLANSGEDLAKLSAWLDAAPNAYVDISGRVGEIGRQPYAARRFLLKYQDRVLFGTDRYPGRLDQPRNKIYYRFLETADEYFDYYDAGFPPEGDWKIYGVFLPDDALKKIYSANADRALGGLRPADAAPAPRP